MASQAFAAQLPDAHILADWVQQTWDLGSVVDVKRINLSENAMYRVTTDQKQAFVLRLSQPGYQTDHSIVAELTWLQHLANRQDLLVQTADVIAARTGTLLQQFSGDPAWRCALFSHIDGQTIARADVSSLDFRTLGATAAQLSDTPVATPMAMERPQWRPDFFLSPTYGWGDWRHAQGITASIDRDLTRDEHRLLTALNSESLKTQLIHGDMRAANLLRCVSSADTAAAPSIALLDFDDAARAPAVVDLAAALSFDEDLETLPDRVEAWLEGYRTIGILPDEQVALIPAVIMLRRLSLLGWMTTHPQAPEAIELGGDFAVRSVGLFDRLTKTVA